MINLLSYMMILGLWLGLGLTPVFADASFRDDFDTDKKQNVLRTGSNSLINHKSNKLQIELGDHEVRFFVNDHLLEEVTDFSLFNFWIGFRVGPRIRISVDYIELSLF